MEKTKACIADELELLATDIEQIGVDLCADPHIAASHSASLQSVDLVSQTARGLALVLRADLDPEAIAGLGLEGLRAKLVASTVQTGMIASPSPQTNCA